MNEKNFEILFLQQAKEFLTSLDKKVYKKLRSDIHKAQIERNDSVFSKLHNTDGIWEFRTSMLKMEYRMLAFWDKNKRAFVVATHGFCKKTQKTPKKEIEKAQQIRKQYYEQ